MMDPSRARLRKVGLATEETMGDYGWSMNFDTSQDIAAVEYGRVLEEARYPE